MKNLEEITSLVPELDRADLERWIHAALIVAEADDGVTRLDDVQIARVRLICALRFDMEVEEETLPVVLDLIDQLHATRDRLHRLSQAVLAQDEEVRAAVIEVLGETRRKR